ncbi:MAG: ABC transporter substrate-binding protein [Candidatus Tectimicrobiota bacterium]
MGHALVLHVVGCVVSIMRPAVRVACRKAPGRVTSLLLLSLTLLTPALGEVRGAKLARPMLIGALTESWGPTPPIVGLRDGLVQLGYREEQDFFLGVRFTRGNRDALLPAARELVGAGAHILFTDSNGTAKAAQRVTTDIPIVFAGVEDPVGAGLVKSFAQPGGNLTGIASLDTELGPKRLQLFHALVPTLKRVLFLYAANDIYAQHAAHLYRWAANRLGITLVEKVVHTEAEVQTTLADLRQLNVDGMLAPRCCALNISGFILEAATHQAVPSMHVNRTFWMEQGALTAFGANHYELGLQAARLMDKILQGAHPSTLPVEANSSIEFTINIPQAKALGLTIDPAVLVQADYVIR